MSDEIIGHYFLQYVIVSTQKQNLESSYRTVYRCDLE